MLALRKETLTNHSAAGETNKHSGRRTDRQMGKRTGGTETDREFKLI